jgi:formylglycine-generating enzyme required for sulfatase activity
VCLTWWDAQAYAYWLTLKTGQRYRLPSEAEWEYAARAGTQTGRYWGWKNEDACAYGNGSDRAAQREVGMIDQFIFLCDDGHPFTAPVHHPDFKPNAFGLKHILGNVWEWTRDCWQENYEGAAPDGTANATGNCSVRVSRGGSWLDDPWNLRSAGRSPITATFRGNYTGFRLARTL